MAHEQFTLFLSGRRSVSWQILYPLFDAFHLHVLHVQTWIDLTDVLNYAERRWVVFVDEFDSILEFTFVLCQYLACMNGLNHNFRNLTSDTEVVLRAAELQYNLLQLLKLVKTVFLSADSNLQK